MSAKKCSTLLISTIICVSLFAFSCIAQEGRIVRETVHSPSLEGNLLGDSPNRPVTIYLPPSYDTNPEMVYPVVYLLHGYTGNNELWTGGSYVKGVNIVNSMKSWLKEGKVKEMILVMPNSYNKLRGSWYANSVVTGKWEDYIVLDLVSYIDKRYRTLKQKESRAISGHSMGGYGSIRLAIQHPYVFGSVGSMDPGLIAYEQILEKSDEITIASLAQTKGIDIFNSLSFDLQVWFSILVSLIPEANNKPFYCDFPYKYDENRNIVKDEDAYNRLLEQDIIFMIDQKPDVLQNMLEVCVIGGANNPGGLIQCRALQKTVNDNNIKQFYQEIPGDHKSMLLGATQITLERFSDAMAFEMLVNVESVGKLATTWGKIRRSR